MQLFAGITFLVLICPLLKIICGSHVEECEPGWTKFDKNCFKTFEQHKNFSDAEQFCHNQQAHLASFHSKMEYQFLVMLVDRLKEDSSVWIGLVGAEAQENPQKSQDGKNLLKLAFVDGSLVNPFSEDNYGFFWGKGFSNQETGPWEPSSVRDRCIELYTPFTSTPRHFGGKMSSSCCAALLKFVCKKERLVSNTLTSSMHTLTTMPTNAPQHSHVKYVSTTMWSIFSSSPKPSLMPSSLPSPNPTPLPRTNTSRKASSPLKPNFSPLQKSLFNPLQSPLFGSLPSLLFGFFQNPLLGSSQVLQPIPKPSPLPTPESSSLQTPVPSPLPLPESSPLPISMQSALPFSESSSLQTPKSSPVPTFVLSSLLTPEPSSLPTPESTSLPTPLPSPLPTLESSPLPTPESSSLQTPESSPLRTPAPSPRPTLEPSSLPAPESSSLSNLHPTSTMPSSKEKEKSPVFFSSAPTTIPAYLPTDSVLTCPPCTCPTLPSYLETSTCSQQTITGALVTVTYKESTFHLTPVQHGDLLYSDSEGSKLLVNGKDLNLWMTLEKDRDNKVSIINDVAQVWEQDSPQTHVYRRSFFDAADNSKKTHSQFKFLEELIEMLKKDALPETVEVKFVPKENLTQEYSFNGCLGNACVQTSIDFNNQSYTLSVPNITELYELQTKLGQLLGMSQHEIISKWLVNNGSLLLQGFDLSSLGNSYLDILLIEKSTSSDIRVIRACSEVCLEIKLAVDDKRYTSYIPSHQTVDGLWKIIKSVTEKDRWIFGDTTQDPTLAGYLMFNETTVLLESYALWMLDEYELEFCSKEKLWKGIAEVEQVIGCSGEVCNQAMFRLTTEPTNAENIIELVFRAENDINQTMDILYEMMEDVFDFVIKDDFGEQKQWLVAEVNMEESLQVRYRNEWLNRKDILILVDKQPN